MNVKNLLNELSNLFFPDCCPVCSTRLLPSEQGVCLQCLHALPKTNNFMEPDNLAETEFVADEAARKPGIVDVFLLQQKSYNFVGRIISKLHSLQFLSNVERTTLFHGTESRHTLVRCLFGNRLSFFLFHILFFYRFYHPFVTRNILYPFDIFESSLLK